MHASSHYLWRLLYYVRHLTWLSSCIFLSSEGVGKESINWWYQGSHDLICWMMNPPSELPYPRTEKKILVFIFDFFHHSLLTKYLWQMCENNTAFQWFPPFFYCMDCLIMFFIVIFPYYITKFLDKTFVIQVIKSTLPKIQHVDIQVKCLGKNCIRRNLQNT